MPANGMMKESWPADNAVICDNCGNVFRIEWLKEGEDYNDFGQRYCPFCGLLTDEWSPLKKKHPNKTFTDKVHF